MAKEKKQFTQTDLDAAVNERDKYWREQRDMRNKSWANDFDILYKSKADLENKLTSLDRQYEIVFEHRNTLLHSLVLMRIQIESLQKEVGITPGPAENTVTRKAL